MSLVAKFINVPFYKRCIDGHRRDYYDPPSAFVEGDMDDGDNNYITTAFLEGDGDDDDRDYDYAPAA